MNYKIVLVDIDTISAGDTIEHDGKLRTVCNKDIKRNTFTGTTIFGDSYRMGQQPVRKVIFHLQTVKPT